MLAAALGRLNGVKPDAVDERTLDGPGEVRLQASWSDGRVVMWAGGPGAGTASDDELGERLGEVEAPAGGWWPHDPVSLPTKELAPARAIGIPQALGWLVTVGAKDRPEGVGASVLWLGRVAVWAVDFVARGAIIPTLQSTGSSFAVRWAPALIDRAKLDAMSRAMPGPVAALDRSDARALTLEVLGATVDAIVRDAAGRLELPAPPPVVRTPADVSEAVVTSLDGTPFDAPARLATPLAERLERWAEPVRGPVDARLVVQLDPPDKGGAWFLSVLGPGQDGRLVPLEVALVDGRSKRHLADETVRLERLLPVLNRPGGQRRGEVVLSQDEAFELMGVTGPSLAAAGFDIRVPAALPPQAPARPAAHGRAGRRLGGRRPPAGRRPVVGGLRRRRAHRRRHPPPGRRGPAARSTRAAAGWRSTASTSTRPPPPWPSGPTGPASPAPRSCATPSASRARGCRGASAWAVPAGPPTCWPAPARCPPRPSPTPRASRARCAATRPRRWPGWGSSTRPAWAAASPSTWAWARRPPCWPTWPASTRRPHRPAEPAPRTLVIAPPAVVGNWAAEASRFAPKLRVVVHHGASRATAEDLKAKAETADVIITTYGTAVRDIDALSGFEWARIVLDEAQAIKNPASDVAQELRRIQARSRLALTGTPVENGLGDLWAILDFTNPGLLGPRAAFVSQLSAASKDGRPSGEHALRALNGILVFRRTKSEPEVAAELPDKIDELDHCTMTPEQVGLYQAVIDRLVQAGESERRQGDILAAITALKQILQPPLRLPGRRPAPGRSVRASWPASRRSSTRSSPPGRRCWSSPTSPSGARSWPTTSRPAPSSRPTATTAACREACATR